MLILLGGSAKLHPPPEHGYPYGCMPWVWLSRLRIHGKWQPWWPAILPWWHTSNPLATSISYCCWGGNRTVVSAPDEARATCAPRPQARQHTSWWKLCKQDIRCRSGTPCAPIYGRWCHSVSHDLHRWHLLLHWPWVPANWHAWYQN